VKRLSVITTLILTACTCFGAGGYKVAIVLPFDTPAGGSLNYIDFYCGAFLAADSLCQTGTPITLKVIDCASWSEADTTAATAELSGVDLIIGPVTLPQQSLLQQFSIAGGIPIVSPLDTRCAPLSETNPYFFNIPSTREIQIDNLISMLAGDEEGDIVIFFNQADSTDLSYALQIESALNKRNLTFSKRSYNILQGRVITEELKKEMGDGRYKKVIIASEDEAFASDVVRNMALLGIDGTNISIYGSNKLRNFETIDASTLYKLSYHFSTAYYVDYTDDATRSFVSNYRELYNTEPTPYAFQGYDILFYFITTMNELGDNFMDFVTYYPKSLLQNRFRFDRSQEESGLTNMGTRDVRFQQDNSISILTSR